jgi:hypothetical protein
MNGICEFFTKNSFARITRHFEQKETGVAFWQKIVWRIVLVHNLKIKTEMPSVISVLLEDNTSFGQLE